MPIGRRLLAAAFVNAMAFSCAGATLKQSAADSSSSQQPAPQPSIRVDQPAPTAPPGYDHTAALTPAPTPTSPPVTSPTPTPTLNPAHDEHHHDGDHHRPAEVLVGPGDGGVIAVGPVGPAQIQPPAVVQQLPTPPQPQAPATQPFDPVAAAQARVDRVVTELRRQFEQSPAYRAALAELHAAQAAYDQTVLTEKQSVKSDPAYRDAMAERDRAAAAVAKLQRSVALTSPATQPDDVPLAQLKAAQAKLIAAKKLSDMENRSIDDNAKVIAARQRIAAGKQKLDALESDYVAGIENNTSWQMAQHLLDAARLAAALGPTGP